MRVAVLFGGTSAEREVSVASAAQIIPALKAAGHEVVAVDSARGRLPAADMRRLLKSGVAPDPPSEKTIADTRAGAVTLSPANLDIRDVDVVFIALHGGAGEDGRLQAVLDLAGVPYTGSNHIASAAAIDKDLSKRVFRSSQVPTPDWLMAPVSAEQVTRDLGWPAIVKPNKQGSTVGLTLVRGPAELDSAIQIAFKFDDEVMVERFVSGREFTVSILTMRPCRSARSLLREKSSTMRQSTSRGLLARCFQPTSRQRRLSGSRAMRGARTERSSLVPTHEQTFDAIRAASTGASKSIRCPA